MQRIYQAQEMLLVGKKQEVIVELRRLMMRHGGNTPLSQILDNQPATRKLSSK
ncbi:hypothetical protein M3661_06080 [Paenibacillus sp. MER 180]|uniref:hypothetical protein n=1 Tax=Paenibacillus TaxID=44249 RepID=UPI000A514E76|nr:MULTISPECIES: hypothetical protein [unclassified Paenibacillus]MCM3289695.1 hypothetical protein [Paenibacillus sp. MER 180]